MLWTTLLIDLSAKEYIEVSWDGKKEQDDTSAISIRKVHNKGMACNAFEEYPSFVKHVSAFMGMVLTAYYVWILPKKRRSIQKYGLSLLLGGAWSNIYDRFVRGYVVDYIGFRSKCRKVSDMTYNLGDFFIFAGSALMAVSSLIRRK